MPSPELKIVTSALESVAEQVIITLALDVVAELVKAPPLGGTPVDTGWARNNWAIQVGSPRTDPIGSRERASEARGVQEQSKASIFGYQVESQTQVFITNNVPYITRLNQGSSQQAPAGFVQQGIRRAIDLLPSKVQPR